MARRSRRAITGRDRDRDWAVEVVASFVNLIHARRSNAFDEAARAQRELRNLGVEVKIRHLPRPTIGALAHA